MSRNQSRGAKIRRLRIPGTIGLLLVFALLVAACGDSSDSESVSMVAPMSADAAMPTTTSAAGQVQVTGGGESAPSGATDDSGLAVPTALTPADIGRDIVYRATIQVAVDNVSSAGSEARTAITALGGIVFGESTTAGDFPRSVLTFKIRPENFEAALEALSKIGDLVDQEVSADDVTDRVVDLQSRITTAEASVVRLRDLLDQANDVEFLAQIEGQLLSRETLLEQLRGQIRTLQDQVALSTITLTITQRATVIPPSAIDLTLGLSENNDDPCPGSLEITVDENGSATLCLEIENVGESTLTDVAVESGRLRLRLVDFTITEGDPTQLQPGERLVATLTLDLDDGRVRRRLAYNGLSIDVHATARPVETPSAAVEAFSQVTLVADRSNPLPGFGDSVGAGWSALTLIAGLLLVAGGVLLPFVPVLVLLVIWIRRRRARWPDPEYVEAEDDALDEADQA